MIKPNTDQKTSNLNRYDGGEKIFFNRIDEQN